MNSSSSAGETSVRRALSNALESDRLARGCFAAFVIVAYPLLIFHFGKNRWFIGDDWDLIVGLDGLSVFTPIEQHWTTLPLLIYRGYFRLFGANFLPFLATVSALHLGIAALLRVLMRRALVSPWMSTLSAALLVLFGPGALAILFAIEITQNLSLVLGLTQLILADAIGPIRRRDWLGLLAGAASLMCSGLGPMLVIAVGLATFFGRGWRVAMFHTLPLAALYCSWFYFTRPLTFQGPDPYSAPFNTSQALEFVWHGLVESFVALGHFKPLALGFFLLLLVGLPLRALASNGKSSRARISAPLALLVCVPLYFAVLALQRSKLGTSYAAYSHHLYTAVCFYLPALACAADAVVRRWPRSTLVVAAMQLMVIPFNAEFDIVGRTNVFLSDAFLQANENRLRAVAHSPYATQALNIDRSKLAVDPWYTPQLKLGWVLDQANSGRIPKPVRVDPSLDDSVQLFYGLTPLGAPRPERKCASYPTPLELHPRQGAEIVVLGPVAIFNIRRERSAELHEDFLPPQDPAQNHAIRIELPEMHLQLEPVEGATSFAYCP